MDFNNELKKEIDAENNLRNQYLLEIQNTLNKLSGILQKNNINGKFNYSLININDNDKSINVGFTFYLNA